MSLPATVVTYAECPLCGYRRGSTTVILFIDQWSSMSFALRGLRDNLRSGQNTRQAIASPGGE